MFLLGALIGCGKEISEKKAQLAPQTRNQMPLQQQQPLPAPVGPLSPEQEAVQGHWRTDCLANPVRAHGYYYRGVLNISGSRYEAEIQNYTNPECDAPGTIGRPPVFSAFFVGEMKLGKAIANETYEVDFGAPAKSVYVGNEDSLQLVKYIYNNPSIALGKRLTVDGNKGEPFLPQVGLASAYKVVLDDKLNPSLVLSMDECVTDGLRAGESTHTTGIVYKRDENRPFKKK